MPGFSALVAAAILAAFVVKKRRRRVRSRCPPSAPEHNVQPKESAAVAAQPPGNQPQVERSLSGKPHGSAAGALQQSQLSDGTSGNGTLHATSTVGTSSAGAGGSATVSSAGGVLAAPQVQPARTLSQPPAPKLTPDSSTPAQPLQEGEQQPTLQQRVAPKPAGTFGSQSVPFTTAVPQTIMEPDMRSKISTALYNMEEQQPPMLFAGRFQLLQDQCHGGQAVVQFARDARGSLKQYAIKCASAVLVAVHSCPPAADCCKHCLVCNLRRP